MYTNILQLSDFHLTCKNVPHLKKELSSSTAMGFSRHISNNDYRLIDIVMILRKIVYNNKKSKKNLISISFIQYRWHCAVDTTFVLYSIVI